MPAQCSDFGQSVTWMTKSFLCYFQRPTLFLLNRMLRSISCMPSICPNRTHTQKKTLEIARFVAKIINTKKKCGRLSFGEKEHIHPSKNEISPKHDMLLRPPSSCRRLFRRFSTFLTFLAFEGRFFSLLTKEVEECMFCWKNSPTCSTLSGSQFSFKWYGTICGTSIKHSFRPNISLFRMWINVRLYLILHFNYFNGHKILESVWNKWKRLMWFTSCEGPVLWVSWKVVDLFY